MEAAENMKAEAEAEQLDALDREGNTEEISMNDPNEPNDGDLSEGDVSL